MQNTGGAILKGMIALLGAGTASVFTPEFTVDYIGVPANVIIACGLGAYAGFAFGDKVEPRGRMFQLFFACVIMGATWTGLTDGAIRHFTDWEPNKGALSGMGAIISCLSRFFMPELIKRIGPWLDKIPFLGPKKQGDEQ